MEKYFYQLEEIENPTIKELFRPIANVLEQYIGTQLDINYTMLNTVYDLLNNEEITNNIKEIRKLARENNNSVIESFVHSFSQNRAGYFRMDSNTDFMKRKQKFIRVLYSYSNLSRNILRYDDFNSLIKNVPSNIKVLLVLGTVPPEEDNIQVGEEIDEIISKQDLKDLYIIISIYGCNTNFFKGIMKKYEAEVVHFCGHGAKHSNGNYVVCFVDSNMKYDTLSHAIGNDKLLVFFNCCFSYELVDGKHKCGDYMIVHRDRVQSDTALAFSSNFYDRFIINKDVSKAYDYSKRKTKNSEGYELK